MKSVIYFFVIGICWRQMGLSLLKYNNLPPITGSLRHRSQTTLWASKKANGKLGMDRWEKAKSPSLEELFIKDGVNHVDSTQKETETTLVAPTRLIPIMPFESPLFLHARELLYIYEMRFRDLMRQVETSDHLLGRCFLSESGEVGEAGSLCRIAEKKQLEDGKGFYVIEAVQRFRIRRIVRTDPFLVAEVEIDSDTLRNTEEEIRVSELLCHDIYALLKIYLRVQRLRQAESDSQQHDAVPQHTHALDPYVCFQPAVYLFRPGGGTEEKDGGRARHEAFSHACANLLSTDPSILQQIFQSQSLHFRLHGIKRILAEAADELSSLMIEDGLLAKSTLQEIIRRSTADVDDDTDLAPPADYHETTLDEEVEPYLSSETLQADLIETARADSDSLSDSGGALLHRNTQLQGEGGPTIDWSEVDWESKSTSFQ